jgi:DNA-binding transcriptional ArsR family regulator
MHAFYMRIAGTHPRIPPDPLSEALVSSSLPFVTAYQSQGALAVEALGEPSRRAIFELLVDGPRTVGELAEVLPISRPAVSQHLKVLHDRGLVDVRPQGTRRLYLVDPDGVEAMRAYLDQMWDSALRAFARAVENDTVQNNEGKRTR